MWLSFLAFMGPCIANLFSCITNKMQRYTVYLFLWNSLHVSGGSAAYHQELKTVYTASGTLSNLYCCLPLLWKSWNTQFWAPDDGQRNCLKNVEDFTGINKLCNVASCWLYRMTQKNGNFWKTQQKLKKSKKKIYWQKLNHYNLPFKRQ